MSKNLRHKAQEPDQPRCRSQPGTARYLDRPIAAPDNEQEQDYPIRTGPEARTIRSARGTTARSTGHSTTGAAGRSAISMPTGCGRWPTGRAISWAYQRAGDRRVSAVLVGMAKSEAGLSYCGVAKRFEKHPDDLERREMYETYSRTQYQLQVSKIKLKAQQRIIVWMAGEDAVHGTKIAYSGGYGTEWWSGRTPSTASPACMTLPGCTSYTPPEQDMCRHGHARTCQRLAVPEKDD